MLCQNICCLFQFLKTFYLVLADDWKTENSLLTFFFLKIYLLHRVLFSLIVKDVVKIFRHYSFWELTDEQSAQTSQVWNPLPPPLPPPFASWLNISPFCLRLWHSPANRRPAISALLSSPLLPGLQPCLQLPATLFIILSCLFVSVGCKFEARPLPPKKNIVYIMLSIYVIRVQTVLGFWGAAAASWVLLRGTGAGRTLKYWRAILQPSEAETFSL